MAWTPGSLTRISSGDDICLPLPSFPGQNSPVRISHRTSDGTAIDNTGQRLFGRGVRPRTVRACVRDADGPRIATVDRGPQALQTHGGLPGRGSHHQERLGPHGLHAPQTAAPAGGRISAGLLLVAPRDP